MQHQKLTKPSAQNTSPKATWSTKQTWKYRTKREAELFRSLCLSQWPAASIFCNPFPVKEGKDLVQQTGSLLGAAQQCSLCLIPKISLETGAGKCNWGRIGPGAGRQRGSSGGAEFQRQQPPLRGAVLTRRDVGPSPVPEVLFLSAKTIRCCSAAHTATKDLVHLKKATQTTLN